MWAVPQFFLRMQWVLWPLYNSASEAILQPAINSIKFNLYSAKTIKLSQDYLYNQSLPKGFAVEKLEPHPVMENCGELIQRVLCV